MRNISYSLVLFSVVLAGCNDVSGGSAPSVVTGDREAELEAIVALEHGLTEEEVDDLYFDAYTSFVYGSDSNGEVRAFPDWEFMAINLKPGEYVNLGNHDSDPQDMTWEIEADKGVLLLAYHEIEGRVSVDGIESNFVEQTINGVDFHLTTLRLSQAGVVKADTFKAAPWAPHLDLMHSYAEQNDFHKAWSGVVTVFDHKDCTMGLHLEASPVDLELSGAFGWLASNGPVDVPVDQELDVSGLLVEDNHTVGPNGRDNSPYFELSEDGLLNGYQKHTTDDGCDVHMVYELG